MIAWSLALAGPASPPAATLTVAQQEADLDQLRALLEELHPGLGVVADPAEVDAAFARARSELVEGASVLGFLRAAMLPVAAMRCAHTVIEPTLQEPALFAAGGYFPLDLWPDGDRLWLDPRGVKGPIREVLAVEGRPVAEVLRDLRDRIESDGGAPAGKDLWIDREPWFAMTALFGPHEGWAVTLREPGGEPVEERYAGMDPRQVRTEADLHPRARPSSPAPGVRYVPVPSLAGSAKESRKGVADLREQAAGEEALILDLRGNGGGRTLSLMDLVALFSDHPVDPYRFGTTKVPWKDWPVGDDGRSHADAHTPGLYGGVAPLGDPPAVRLVVLVDEGTGSSASDLAYLLRREAGAAIVGRETGGGAWAQTAETTIYRELERSGLLVQVPLVTVAMGPDELRGRGVIPDFPVRPTVEDLAFGRDPALACAVAVARSLPCPPEPAAPAAPAAP